MNGIAHLSFGPPSLIHPHQSVAVRGSVSFAEVLDGRASALAPAPLDRALAFGASGVFAPSRPQDAEVSASVPGDQSAPRGQEAVESGNAVSSPFQAPPESDGEAAGTDHGPVVRRPAPAEKAPEPQGSHSEFEPASTALAYQRAELAKGMVSATRQTARAGSPAKPQVEPASRPQPATLAVCMVDGAARVVGRADVPAGAALDRLLRILKDHGLALESLRLNGVDVAADHSRVEGGRHGARTR